MLNGRLYRLGLVPALLSLVIVAFSLSASPPALTSTLAPDAFEGSRAFGDLRDLAREFPSRRPGSEGDERLATHIARSLEALGGTAGGGFSVSTRHFSAHTIDGERSLTTVIAQRPGSTGATPIVILAHRDAALRTSQAELSGTAALLELARAFAVSETKRTIVLVSTSGGSGGAAGAADFAAREGPADAAIVIGDIAGTSASKPFVVPFSDGFGAAPLQLQHTVDGAITQEVGSDPGAPTTIGQLAHLAFPFAPGEQGVLDGRGLPAVLVQVSGERGPAPTEPVSAEGLQSFGRAVLSAVYALDAAPDVSSTMQTGLVVQHETIPAWALRLLVGSLLIGPLMVLVDALARLRRHREPVALWTLWTLGCAAPFLISAAFAYVLGRLGAVGAASSVPGLPSALPFDGSAAKAVTAIALVLGLSWLAWLAVASRLGVGARPDPEAAGVPVLLVLVAVCAVAWVVDPFTALLLVPALHLWLLLASAETLPRPMPALGLVALGLAPIALLVSFYAHQLGMGPAGVAWTTVLLLAGGHVGLLGATVWSFVLGCAVAATLVALNAPGGRSRPGFERVGITIRGPGTYAGPGSLGGTSSALRR